MDMLEQIIADHRKKVELLDEQIDRLQDERNAVAIALEAYVKAAEIRPSISAEESQRPQNETRPRGRQPGSIATDWRVLMRRLVAHGRPWLNYIAMHKECEKVDIKIKLASMRGRMRHYTALGLFDEVDGKFRVSDEAIERFQLVDGGVVANTATVSEPETTDLGDDPPQSKARSIIEMLSPKTASS